MTKSSTHDLARQRRMGQNLPSAELSEPEAEESTLAEPRVLVEVRDGFHVWRQLAPGESVGDPNVDAISAKMKQLVETGIVLVNSATMQVDWPEGTPPVPQPADVVDVHPAPKAKKPAAKKPAAKK